MNSDLRMQLQIARTHHYGDIIRTTLFSLLGLGALIGFGAESIDIPLAVLTVAVTLFGILAGGTALDDIATLRDDMDEATGTSNYGQLVKGRNLGLLKMISGTLIGLTGLGLLLSIFLL